MAIGSGEKENKYPPKEGEIGDLTKNDKGTQIIKVVQDITLRAGDKLIFEPFDKQLEGLVAKGFMSEEKANETFKSVGSWKLGRLKKLPTLPAK